MENLFWIGFVGAAIALIFALLQRNKVMKFSEGDEKMVKLASAIRQGANAYLKAQYTTVAKVFAIVFVILLIIAFASKGEMLSKVTPFAFLTGGIWSMLAGFIGMRGFFFRLRHGLYRCGSGHAGHHPLVLHPPLCSRDQ